jgi:uncharacterized membrane protein
MGLGPIEIVTIVFPGSRFNGAVLPQLAALVESGTVRIVDALFVARGSDGTLDTIEIDDATDDGIGELGSLIHEANGLISDDDVEQLTEALSPGSSAVLLVFEHSWVIPLRDAISASGGELLESIRVPGPVVDEVLAAIEEGGKK